MIRCKNNVNCYYNHIKHHFQCGNCYSEICELCYPEDFFYLCKSCLDFYCQSCVYSNQENFRKFYFYKTIKKCWLCKNNS